MADIKRTDKTGAINTMIGVIGLAPITSLATENRTADVVSALNVLDEITLAVLTDGWDFNIEENYPFVPNSDDEIVLSDNILEFVFPNTTARIVERDGRLFNKTDRTFKFTDGTLEGTVKLILDFDELPQAARRYIMIRAARTFAERTVGDPESSTYTSRDEIEAEASLIEYEGQTANHSVFDEYDSYYIAFEDRGYY